MIQPRNTLVVLRLIEQKEKKVGKITLPTGNVFYCEAEVVAVGPGTVGAAGGRSETFDLSVGQLVYVKHKQPERNPQMPSGFSAVYAGTPFEENGVNYYLFLETSIVGILAEAGKWDRAASLPTVAPASLN